MTDDENNWRRDFFKLFINRDSNDRDKGWELLIEKRPHKFCKYMKPGHAIDFLRTFRLWHSSMKKFNDKYDGWWYEIDEINNCTEEQKTAIRYFREIVGYVNRVDTIFNLWKVCSFTINPFNEKMWSEYAAHSTGVCFEFDIDDSNSVYLPQIYKNLYPVIYFKDKVNLTEFVLSYNDDGWYNHISETEFQHYFILLCPLLKDAAYSNEDEWRSVWQDPHYDGEIYQGYFEYPTYPSRIYLGQRIKPRTKHKIVNAIKNKRIKCEIYRITLQNGKLHPVAIRV